MPTVVNSVGSCRVSSTRHTSSSQYALTSVLSAVILLLFSSCTTLLFYGTARLVPVSCHLECVFKMFTKDTCTLLVYRSQILAQNLTTALPFSAGLRSRDPPPLDKKFTSGCQNKALTFYAQDVKQRNGIWLHNAQIP